MTRITDIRTVGIPVSDQDRALAFYVDKLGFEKRMDAEFAPGRRWIEVAAPGAGTSVALVSAGDDAPAGVDTGIRFTTEDADADHASMVAGGVDVDAEVLRMGGVPPMFGFRDPDGNSLYVVQVP